jgi:hypothetical protein
MFLLQVHNLALYPERHSWCQATPIRQEIAHSPECEPKVIDNMVCLGACFSYSVPRAQDYEPIAPYCDKCDKTFSSWTVVNYILLISKEFLPVHIAPKDIYANALETQKSLLAE